MLIVFVCLVSLFVYLKNNYLLKKQSGFFKSTQSALHLMINENIRILSQRAIIAFFLVLFMFFTKQFISINIKTSKLVVDLSEMITDEKSLFKSNKKVAWLAGERDIDLTRTSPKNTFLYNLYHLKNENPPFFIRKVIDDQMMKAQKNKFFVS